MNRLILITGGARAGKTQFALALARAHPGPVTYLATAQALDSEMAARIARHRAERPPSWRTIEEPIAPVTALEAAGSHGLVVFDCLTVWTSNLLINALPPSAFTREQMEDALGQVRTAVEGLLDWQHRSGVGLIAVTNEVGLGIVPATPLGRLYRDCLGLANQLIAARAARVYLVVSGLALELRSAGAFPVR